jgi:hypothetical protein
MNQENKITNIYNKILRAVNQNHRKLLLNNLDIDDDDFKNINIDFNKILYNNQSFWEVDLSFNSIKNLYGK